MAGLTKTFDSPDEPLHDLLKAAQSGKTQLPDFQRGWVWDDEHIRSLLASISQSYPIGVVMMMQTGNPDVQFKPRPVEGVGAHWLPEPERLILDGQQRMTSLVQALMLDKPAQTRNARGKAIERWYYIDIDRALDPEADREEAIVGVPADRTVRNFRGKVEADYSTRVRECAAGVFPLRLVFDQAALNEWQMEFLSSGGNLSQERLTTWSTFMAEIVQRFQQYQVPVIVLRKEVPKEAVCQVFEKVNTGGVALTVFELLTATFAADDFALREDWKAREERLSQRAVLRGVTSDDFLQAITLLATRQRRLDAIESGTKVEQAPGISCKRREVLRLRLDEYKRWAEAVTEGFLATAPVLHSLDLFAAKDLPYRTQLIPLAAILTALGQRREAEGVRRMLRRWYWCGVFGELYGSATEFRFARDLPEVLAWLDGWTEPDTVAEANFSPDRLDTLRTRNSAAYKGLYALLIGQGRDWRTGDVANDAATYFDEQVDIHHVFPQDWCAKNAILMDECNSIVNKTALGARTNRIIGGDAPSTYLPKLQAKHAQVDQATMDAMLQTHAIDPQTLRADDFAAFYEARKSALLARIAEAIGKALEDEVDEAAVVTGAGAAA